MYQCISALEVFLNDMRYINPRFTYFYLLLLTIIETRRDATSVPVHRLYLSLTRLNTDTVH